MKSRYISPIALLPFLLLILNLLAARPVKSIDAAGSNADTEYIRSSCASTLYPDVCYSSLSRYAGEVKKDPNLLAQVAISESLLRIRKMAAYLSNLTEQAGNGPAAVLHDCASNFERAEEQIGDSFKQMNGSNPSGLQMSNVQTWMSAALTDQGTCTDGLEEVEDFPLKSDVKRRTTHVKKVTSNALALVNSFVNQKAT
ncbi:hypothetical protein SAY86_025596 [Trapa natans]|uniref:Pectinesterase inhibitor domain-containing protein n=1 Tax=Trapa natans TaxID=22666 RepID=A0AAN7M8T8_TRANT|nr:hypothetical protein SAY86_025596 [Trapa natans]